MTDHNRKVGEFHTHVADDSLILLLDSIIADAVEKLGKHPSLQRVEAEYEEHIADLKRQADALIGLAKLAGAKVNERSLAKLNDVLSTTRNVRAGRTAILMHRVMEHMCNLDRERVSTFLDDLDGYANCVVAIERDERKLRDATPEGKAGAH
jgi:hypothetical protein